MLPVDVYRDYEGYLYVCGLVIKGVRKKML